MSREVLIAPEHHIVIPNPTVPPSEPTAGAPEHNAATNDATNLDEPSSSTQESDTVSTNDGNQSAQHSPTVREIHKNSWLKRMPCSDRKSSRFSKSQKPEKFWVVFCVHDDKEAFLEFYENRRSAYSHKPLTEVSLNQCLHISPTIVVQENDHEFVITLDTQIIKLAASTREQMIEWMDVMRSKLRDLGVLEPKDNIYSKEPIAVSKPLANLSYPFNTGEIVSQDGTHAYQNTFFRDMSRLSLRDPNSPLPPVPATLPQSSDTSERTISTATVVYVRNPCPLQTSPSTVAPVVTDQPRISESESLNTTPENLHTTQSSSTSVINPFFFGAPSDPVPLRKSIQRSQSTIASVSGSTIPTQSSSVPDTPLSADSSIYEPLFCATPLNANEQITGIVIPNPNYEHPPSPQRRPLSESVPTLPPRMSADRRRMSSSVLGEMQQDIHRAVRSRGLSNLTSTSEPSLNVPIHNSSINTNQSSQHRIFAERTLTPPPPSPNTLLSQQTPVQNTNRSIRLPSEEGPPPYNSIVSQTSPTRSSQPSSSTERSPVDANNRPLSLREAQVLKLQGEINHKSGVRLVLRKKDCVNAIALVECLGFVWVSGWKQKEHPLLHNTFHIGDRIISIAGHRIHNLQEAYKAIKHQPLIVEFIVRRIPYGRALAIKRDYEGQDLGIVREGGTAEVKEVRPEGLVARHGLPPKAPSVEGNSSCNWILTEINHRPLNLFFKENEVQDRLNAVGLDISILVQPLDLVKVLKKQLKTIRGYKDYIVQ